MMLRFAIEGGPSVELDDEQRDRMTPEVAEDYLSRMRAQCIHAYQEITAFGLALEAPEADDH